MITFTGDSQPRNGAEGPGLFYSSPAPAKGQLTASFCLRCTALGIKFVWWAVLSLWCVRLVKTLRTGREYSLHNSKQLQEGQLPFYNFLQQPQGHLSTNVIRILLVYCLFIQQQIAIAFHRHYSQCLKPNVFQ